ncbi:hypothetical protein MBLNU459_g7477t1 [Dothideomycetes sp. NU459]
MIAATDQRSAESAFSSLPILDLSWASDPSKKPDLLRQLHDALFNIGFLYVVNHGVAPQVISNLTSRLSNLFDLPDTQKNALSKLNSAHFLGYSGFAEETTLGKQDLREQFDYATELPTVPQSGPPEQARLLEKLERDFSKLYWRLRGPNQWPPEHLAPGFREALTNYHDAVQALSYRFVHLIEEAFGIPVGTFDDFFGTNAARTKTWMPPQHRIKLVKYPPSASEEQSQGVGAHKDSSGWLTFLYQVGNQKGLEVVDATGQWIAVPPIDGTFVVNFGNAFEAATEGAVKATVHRVTVRASKYVSFLIRY